MQTNLKQQLQQQQQQHKDYYKAFYSRNPNEILIYENSTDITPPTPPTNNKNSIADVDDTAYDNDDGLTDSDELFYDQDHDYDYDDNQKFMKSQLNNNYNFNINNNNNNNRKHFSSSAVENSYFNNQLQQQQQNQPQQQQQQMKSNTINKQVYKRPPLPVLNYAALSASSYNSNNNKLIFKSPYFTNVLSKNKSTSCENQEQLLSDNTNSNSNNSNTTKTYINSSSSNHSGNAFNTVGSIANSYNGSSSNNNKLSSSTSQLNTSTTNINADLNNNNQLPLSPNSTIKAGIVENLRKKFLDNNNSTTGTGLKPMRIPLATLQSTNVVKKTKLSDSSDLSGFSHASIKIEKNHDESNDLKVLSPLQVNTNEIQAKKVSNKFRIKSIERTLSTSAHIDDTYKLVKQSLKELRNDDKYIENIFLQIHQKLQDVANCLFTNIDFNDSLNTSLTTNTTINNHNINAINEHNYDKINENIENLNIIHNNLVNDNYLTLNDDNELYIIENSLNKKKLSTMGRQQTFSPGDQRLKHYF